MTYELVFGWPQGLYFGWLLIGILFHTYGHNPDYKAGFSRLFSHAFILVPLMYWGGFFTRAVAN